jgi:hypothetical protein
MAKKKTLGRYQIFTVAAKHIGMDIGNFSRYVKSGKIKAEEMQIYIKDKDSVFHEVGTSTIKVVDITTLEQKK